MNRVGRAPAAGGFLARVVGVAARLNRAVLRHWPPFLGKILIWRAINRAINRHGVELIGEAQWGGRFSCDLRDFVQSRIYYAGVWEPSLTRYIQQRLQPGDTFVDVGANIGYDSILAASLVGPEGRVIAIEASPSIFARLERTLALNATRNVTALNVAVASERGMAEVFLGPAGNLGATSLLGESGSVAEARVRAAPLGDIVDEASLRAARMFKIDVEGFEAPVLRSLLDALPLLRSDVEIVAEIAPERLARSGTSAAGLFEEFRRAGFHWLVIDNDYGWAGYYRTKPHPPTPTDAIPTAQTDVVFRRVG